MISLLQRGRAAISHARDRRVLRMARPDAPRQRPTTPADWAHTASGGQWVCLPHMDVLNRALCRLAAKRARGVDGRLIIMAPPQHGKSSLCSQYFPGWWLGTFPSDPIILSAYESDFAARWGRMARDAFAEFGPSVFGIGVNPNVASTTHWEVDRVQPGLAPGSMTTAGAGGAITGRSARLFLIDDPIKGAAEAASETERRNQWEWFISVARTRLRRGSCMLMIYTAWHEDDLGQRIIRASVSGEIEPWEVLRIPAISESQEDRDEWAERLGLPTGQPDPIGREPGQALWPEVHPLEELEQSRKADVYYFESMYQGRPQPRGGGFFKGEWFTRNVVSGVPVGCEFTRAWDFASSDIDGDYTVGVLMARDPQGTFYIVDVVRGRWAPGSRDAIIRATAESDASHYGNVHIRGEVQPGAAGKDHLLAFVRMLAGYNVHGTPTSGSKEVRAEPFASQAQVGNVKMVAGHWNDAYVSELASFPRGKHDDQVDASCYSFNSLAGVVPAEWDRSPLSGYRGRVA